MAICNVCVQVPLCVVCVVLASPLPQVLSIVFWHRDLLPAVYALGYTHSHTLTLAFVLVWLLHLLLTCIITYLAYTVDLSFAKMKMYSFHLQEIPINKNDNFQLVLQLHYKDLQSILPSSVKCSETGIS